MVQKVWARRYFCYWGTEARPPLIHLNKENWNSQRAVALWLSDDYWTPAVGWLLEILRLGLGIPSVPCLQLFHNELGMRRICARWIPHMIDEKRPGMLQTAILHHDNASSHWAAQTTETIIRYGFELLDHTLLTRLGSLWFFSFSIDQECFERYVTWGLCWFSSCS